MSRAAGRAGKHRLQAGRTQQAAWESLGGRRVGGGGGVEDEFEPLDFNPAARMRSQGGLHCKGM